MNVLQVENLIRSYRKSVIKESEEDVKVLKGISFQVTEGEFVGIMGKSGCGKTTLLKTLGMIDKPTDGTIKFMGEDTSELYGDKLADIRNSKIVFIFQYFYVFFYVFFHIIFVYVFIKHKYFIFKFSFQISPFSLYFPLRGVSRLSSLTDPFSFSLFFQNLDTLQPFKPGVRRCSNPHVF